MNHPDTFRDLKKAVAASRTEPAQVNGVVAVLSAMGYQGAAKPEVQTLAGRPGWRVYIWPDCPFGEALVLATGANYTPQLALASDIPSEVRAGRLYVELETLTGHVRGLGGAARAASRAVGRPATTTAQARRVRATPSAEAKATTEARALGVDAGAVLEVAAQAAAELGAAEVTVKHVDAVLAEIKAHGDRILREHASRRGTMARTPQKSAGEGVWESLGAERDRGVAESEARIKAKQKERRDEGDRRVSKALTEIAYYKEYGGESYRNKAVHAINHAKEIFADGAGLDERLIAADQELDRKSVSATERKRVMAGLQEARDRFDSAIDKYNRGRIQAAEVTVAYMQVKDAAEHVWASMYTNGRDGDEAKSALGHAERERKKIDEHSRDLAKAKEEYAWRYENAAKFSNERITADQYPERDIKQYAANFGKQLREVEAQQPYPGAEAEYNELVKVLRFIVDRFNGELANREHKNVASSAADEKAELAAFLKNLLG